MMSAHLDSLLKRAAENPPSISEDREGDFYFDFEAAAYRCQWIQRYLVHPAGSLAGQPFVLQDWQILEVVAPLFGWKRRSDGTRRFRELYLFIPRGNGKTPLLAAVCALALLADNEPTPEGFVAAPGDEQRDRAFGDIAAMIGGGPLGREIEAFDKVILASRNAGTIKKLTSSGDTKHGFRPSFMLNDEMHAWKKRELYKSLHTAIPKRRQCLALWASTAGHDRSTLGYALFLEAEQIVQGIIDEPSILAVVHAAGVDEDWQDPQVWRRVNKNVDIAFPFSNLEDAARKAARSPLGENDFRQLHLNQWVGQAKRWLSTSEWDIGRDPLPWQPGDPLDCPAFYDRPCFIGIDLALVQDLSAVTLYFPAGDGFARAAMLSKGYLPAENLAARAVADKTEYQNWARPDQGFLTITAGKTTDLEVIEGEVISLFKRYKRILGIGFDHRFAHEMMRRLGPLGLPVIDVPQNYSKMTPPCAELERLILDHAIHHGGNPLLRSSVDNVALKRDPKGTGQMMPDKGRSGGRIDPLSAALNAIACSLGTPMEAPKYEFFVL